MTSIPDSRDPDAGVATVRVADEHSLAAFATKLAAALPRPAFVALYGDLGAGKTTLVKAIAAAVGIDPTEVVSPTFGLVHEHAGPAVRILHADMYRLGAAGDLWELGWQDAVARADWVFVEWPERIAAALPAERLDITIGIDSPTARTLALAARGPAHAAAVAAIAGS